MSPRSVLNIGLAALAAIGTSAHSVAGDIWVDSSQQSEGDGSLGNPYKTITNAMDNASTGDTIKVLESTVDYNVDDNGESFPITIKNQVKIVGQGATVEDYPRIGGDVDDSTVEALFVAEQNTTGTRSGIEIKKLYFVGEETTDENAPSAARFAVRNGGTLSNCTFVANYCERSLMDHDTDPARATVVVDVGEGSATVTITRNTIYASERGAIEQKLNGNSSSTDHKANPDTTILNNEIFLDGTDTATFGIKVGGVAEAWTGAGTGFVIRGNTVDSTGATGSGGIGIGIDVEVDVLGDGSILFSNGNTFVVANEVKGCTGSGIRLRSEQAVDAESHLSCWDLERNVVSDNDGAGLEVDWGAVSATVGGGYLNFESDSNMFVDNDIGVHLHSGNGPDSMSTASLLNETIAMNDSYGLQLDDLGNGTLKQLINCIVFFNNSSNAQSGGTSSIPATASIEYNDWEGLWPLEDGNIDDDPLFVNENAGDYHLTSSSPCVDTGDDTPNGVDVGEFDFEGDDRQIDGGSGDVVVDIGADEYDPGT